MPSDRFGTFGFRLTAGFGVAPKPDRSWQGKIAGRPGPVLVRGPRWLGGEGVQFAEPFLPGRPAFKSTSQPQHFVRYDYAVCGTAH